MTCAEKREICFGGGGCLQFRRGELGWGRRRRNRRGECRQSGHILTFTDGITDRILLSEIPSAILTVNQSRHCTEIPIWIPWLFCWQFWRWIGHITIRSSRFESLGDFVGKIARKNFHVSEPPFFLILNIPSVILSVYTDR